MSLSLHGMANYLSIIAVAIASLPVAVTLSHSAGNRSLYILPNSHPPFPNSTSSQQSKFKASSWKTETSQFPTTYGPYSPATGLTVDTWDSHSKSLALNTNTSSFANVLNGGNARITTLGRQSKSSAPGGAHFSSEAHLATNTIMGPGSTNTQHVRISTSAMSTTATPIANSVGSPPADPQDWTTLGLASIASTPVPLPGSPVVSQSGAVSTLPQFSVTEAFDTSHKHSYTVLSGDSIIHYTRATFSDLATITAPTTITTPIVESGRNGRSSTASAAVIIVGPGGTW